MRSTAPPPRRSACRTARSPTRHASVAGRTSPWPIVLRPSSARASRSGPRSSRTLPKPRPPRRRGMAALLRYVAWRHLRLTALRTLLVCLSIALAVAMLVCVQETVGGAAASLAHALEDGAGRAQLEVVGQDETGIDES